jgi:quercetin dioxygenase-like cupin family protein
MPGNFIPALDYAQENEAKPHKYTFLQSERLLVGLNTLLPGQAQPLHDHPQQDKFYFVLEGHGRFTVGEEVQECGAGMLVLAPAGIIHGVNNDGTQRLTFLTVIAPFGAGH